MRANRPNWYKLKVTSAMSNSCGTPMMKCSPGLALGSMGFPQEYWWSKLSFSGPGIFWPMDWIMPPVVTLWARAVICSLAALELHVNAGTSAVSKTVEAFEAHNSPSVLLYTGALVQQALCPVEENPSVDSPKWECPTPPGSIIHTLQSQNHRSSEMDLGAPYPN